MRGGRLATGTQGIGGVEAEGWPTPRGREKGDRGAGEEEKRSAPSGNRTRGISMATRYFTTKPTALCEPKPSEYHIANTPTYHDTKTQQLHQTRAHSHHHHIAQPLFTSPLFFFLASFLRVPLSDRHLAPAASYVRFDTLPTTTTAAVSPCLAKAYRVDAKQEAIPKR